MKFTIVASMLALFLGSAVYASPAPVPVPAPQLGGVVDSLTSGLLGGGGGSSGGSSDTGGESQHDIQDENTR